MGAWFKVRSLLGGIMQGLACEILVSVHSVNVKLTLGMAWGLGFQVVVRFRVGIWRTCPPYTLTPESNEL